jgi:exodeoxyribonuclease VII large subunit
MELVKGYTVTEISKEIKNIFDKNFFYIKIHGEITNFKKHFSGHLYFSLKDDSSMINVVMFKNYSEYCKIDLVDGMEVIVSGKLAIYKERSNYQLMAEIVQLSGIGDILKIIQDRKEKLAKEGLFDISRKREIKKNPKKIGLITAESGAGLQDILARLEERVCPQIFLYSTLVQGKEAPIEIIEAINYFNNLENVDVIVITRGGGSVEDLMSFNDENLVRTVANSKIPTITAVGHEIDWTLVDFASDYRLPTPTSVAEYLTISKDQAYINLKNLFTKLLKVLRNKYYKKYYKIKYIMKNFINKKKNFYLKNIFRLNYIILKTKNLFKIRFFEYKRRKILLESMDINKVIKLKYSKFTNKLENIILKIKIYEKKYPIFKNSLGKIINFKKDLDIRLEYILEFPDGNIKIKIFD